MAFNKILKSSFPFEVLNKDLKLIFVSNLAGSFGDGLYAYILPYYMRESLSATSVEVGILYAAVGVVAAVTLLFAGMIADKYDRKKIMIAGWLVAASADNFLLCNELASNVAGNDSLGFLAWRTNINRLHNNIRG